MEYLTASGLNHFIFSHNRKYGVGVCWHWASCCSLSFRLFCSLFHHLLYVTSCAPAGSLVGLALNTRMVFKVRRQRDQTEGCDFSRKPRTSLQQACSHPSPHSSLARAGHMTGLPRWLSGKESACQCRKCRRCGFDPWVRKIHPGGGNDNPLQCSYLGNPMDRGTGGLQSMQSESDTTEQLRTHEQSYGHHLLQGMLGKLVLHFSGGNEQERKGWDWLGTAFVHGGREQGKFWKLTKGSFVEMVELEGYVGACISLLGLP